jgi:Uma2 family endonuclease
MNRRVAALTSARGFRYVEPLVPVVFPEEEQVPQGQLHFELRTLLYQLLSDYLGLESTVGSDQFVYFDAADPSQCVAPDVYVRLEPRGEPIRSWKTWERGAPEVAVEIISDSDATENTWAQKLAAYRRLGVCELVRFDPESSDNTRLRIWDRVEEALVERELSSGFIPSSVLDLHWVIAPAEDHQVALRIAEANRTLVPTRLEARQAEAEARQAAEARIRELEAQLKLARQ